MSDLAERISRGDRRAAARLMRLLDDDVDGAYDQLRKLFPKTGNAYIVGITGSPGSGKSTLTNQLIRAWRTQGKTVGVVAIDPTSPFSGGAILGDRIRMQDHEADPDVFVRSLATRGNLGGLSRSTRDVMQVMDAMGKDVILIETVGVGQDEIDIVGTAHTSLVVLVPGMGDDIQAIKAGILEIADIFVLNKSDRSGADRTEREIRTLIELCGPSESGWLPPIERTVAVKSEGIDDLLQTIGKHHRHLRESGELQKRQRRGLEAAVWDSVQYQLMRQAKSKVREGSALAAQMQKMFAGELDPHTLARAIVEAST